MTRQEAKVRYAQIVEKINKEERDAAAKRELFAHFTR